jgi:hypothetical protein
MDDPVKYIKTYALVEVVDEQGRFITLKPVDCLAPARKTKVINVHKDHSTFTGTVTELLEENILVT